MSQETATLDQDLELARKKASEQNAQLRNERNTRGANAARKGSLQVSPAGSPRNFGERVKNMFSNLAKAMEGDHESHKYRS